MSQTQLFDLPDQIPDKPRVSICSPKIIIISILAAYFVGRNIYIHYEHPITPPTNVPEVDHWQNFKQSADRLGGYAIVTVVAGTLFFYLRRQNDKIEEEKYLKMKKEQEEREQAERKAQAEREQKIFKKLEEEEKRQRQKQVSKGSQPNDQQIKEQADNERENQSNDTKLKCE